MANTNILFLFETLVLNALHTSHYPKEVPWELPEGWAWIYGQDLFSPMESITPKGDYFDYIDIDAIDNQRSIISSPKRIPVKNAPSRASRKTRRGDVLFSMVRPYLRNIARVDYDNCIASTGFYVCHSSGLVTSNYCFILMLSNYVVEGLNQYMKGDNSPSINNNHITSWLYPVPPISEQERISAAVDKLLYCIDVLFDGEKRIFESIVTTKTKILDLAIHGKLVPQDPSEEPALDLLRRINPAFTPSHNLHYEGDLPKGWCFSTLGELFQHNTGKALNAVDSKGEMLRYITTSNLYWDRFELSEVRTMPFTEAEKDKCRAVKGDLLVCEGGDIGRAAIWPYDESIMIQNHIHRMRPKTEVSVRFFYYVLNLYKRKGLIGGKGIGIQGLSSRELDKMIIPVPPVKEQHRIVTAIEEKFAVLNEIVEAC